MGTVLRVTRPASSWDRVEAGTDTALRELALRGYRLGIISNSSGTLAEHLRGLEVIPARGGKPKVELPGFIDRQMAMGLEYLRKQVKEK